MPFVNRLGPSHSRPPGQDPVPTLKPSVSKGVLSNIAGVSILLAGPIAVPLALPTLLVTSSPALAQIASALLSPVLSGLIRSSVDNVDNLQVQVQGSDQDILSGTIPAADVAGTNIQYEGFQISQLQLSGQNIRLNANELMQGSPLRLLEPLRIQVVMQLTEADLNQTLKAPLIQEQLASAKVTLPAGGESIPFLIREPSVELLPDQVEIQATLITPDNQAVPFTMRTGLQSQNQNQLVLVDPVWVSGEQSLPIPGLDQLAIQLDQDVEVEQLQILDNQIVYAGILTIRPEELSSTAQ